MYASQRQPATDVVAGFDIMHSAIDMMYLLLAKLCMGKMLQMVARMAQSLRKPT
jgi:hypothetical protein